MKFNKILWITAIASSALAILSYMAISYQHAGGEPYFPLYHFVWDNEILIQWIFTITTFTTPAAWLTLAALQIQKANKTKPVPEFTKERKFREMRLLALIIAVVPALGLFPFLISLAITQVLERGNFIYGAVEGLGLISMPIIFGGPFIMFALLIAAIAVWTKKPIDPEAKTPQPHLTQILLAIPTAAMPAIAFVLIWLQSFKCDLEPCGTIFDGPITQAALIAYAVLLAVLATIWLRTKNTKTNTPN